MARRVGQFIALRRPGPVASGRRLNPLWAVVGGLAGLVTVLAIGDGLAATLAAEWRETIVPTFLKLYMSGLALC